MKVRQILEKKGSTAVFTIPASATLKQLAVQLSEMRCGALLIMGDGRTLAGIISERDLVRQLAIGADPEKVTVGEIMTCELVSVGPDENINDVMDLMVSKRIRHLPVVSEEGPHGLVTVRDIIHAIREAERDDVASLVDYIQSEVDARQVDAGSGSDH